jgi:hypothetical protein
MNNNNSSNNGNNDLIWVEDYTQLLRRDRLGNFLPQLNMSFGERINAIVRLSFYAGIVFALVQNNYLYLFIPIVVLLITYLVYVFQSDDIKENYRNLSNNKLDGSGVEDKENARNMQIAKNPLFSHYKKMEAGNQTSKGCVRTTPDNPFMNPLAADDRKRPKACSVINDVELANQVEANFNINLFRDINDVYNRNHSERQFYTVPSTTFANEQGKFAQWLYGSPPTCKEGNGNQCVANNHTRLNQSSYKFVY